MEVLINLIVVRAYFLDVSLGIRDPDTLLLIQLIQF